MSGIPVCLTFRKVFIASVFGVGMFLVPNGVQSAVNNSATLQWAANQEPDLGGYTVYHGTIQGIYSDSQDAGNTPTYRYANLEPNHTHYFSVTAYDKAGNESLPSPEVHKTIIAPDSVLSVSVTGDGTVRSSPAGLSCSSGTCSGTFTQGSSVTLTATPGIGKIFGGWNGSCSGTGSCVVPISTSSSSVSANFASSPSVSTSLTPSPPPSWSLEEQQQLLQAYEEMQRTRVEVQRDKAEKQLANAKQQSTREERLLVQARIQVLREEELIAKTPEQRAKVQEQMALAREQWKRARVEEQRAGEQKQLAQAKYNKSKGQHKLTTVEYRKARSQKQLVTATSRIFKYRNALAAIETRLASTNHPDAVLRLNKSKEKYSIALAKSQERYSTALKYQERYSMN